jgi:hypothetical protein
MEIPLNQYKLQNFYFRINFWHVDIDEICEKWVPSLFSPIIFIPKWTELKTGNPIPSSIYDIKYPFLNKNKLIQNILYEIKFPNCSLILGRAL